MSRQGEEGWYPECKKCGGANLGSEVICVQCYMKMLEKFRKEITKMQKLFNEFINNITLST